MLIRTLFGYKATQCLYVAAKLNIADYLVSESRTIDELAKLTNTHQESLYRVLRCLVSLNIFQEESPKVFALNANARQLVSDTENSIKDFVILCGEELYQSAGELLYTVKSGLPAFNHIYGMSHWEFLEKNPDKAAIFHQAMEKGSKNTVKDVMNHYDFSPNHNIVDVGGGKGHLLAEILSRNIRARGTVFDLENATKLAVPYIAEKKLLNRCDIITGNFFESIPAGGDLYLLKVILHDWDDEHAKLILNNCYQAMTKGSKILLIEKVIENNEHNESACLGDINMLVTYMGKERTPGEFQQLLESAGFTYLRKIRTNTAFSLIEAEK